MMSRRELRTRFAISRIGGSLIGLMHEIIAQGGNVTNQRRRERSVYDCEVSRMYSKRGTCEYSCGAEDVVICSYR